jgi:16S rRNA (cytosine1407-C5)-methyltransferase
MDDSLERYRGLLSAAEFEQLLQAVQRPLPAAIRVNTLKTTVKDALDTWPAWYAWQVQPVPFCETGWQVTGEDIAKTLEHKMGFYYVQGAASMLPAELFDFGNSRNTSSASILSLSKDARHENAPWHKPHPSTSSGCSEENAGELILDMAAAPGGKTTHLVCKTGDRGLIVANDASARRIPALRARLQDWGAMNAVVTNYPGERFGIWFPETFDKVLLDAPCSGESLRTAERRRARPVSTRERQALRQRQLKLLVSALQTLRPGGEVVYATCTLAPEEDESVLDALLGLYPQRVTVEAVDRVLPIPAPALASDEGCVFHPDVRRAVRLWPHLYDTSGFFAALIRKRDSTAVQSRHPPVRSLEDAGLTRLNRREEAGVFDRLLQAYGFDFAAVAGRQGLTLWSHGGSVYAVAERFLSCFADLPCVAAGMLVGEQDGEGFAPSHELVARFGAQFTGHRLALSDDQAEVWLAGRDLRGAEAPSYLSGAIILLQDGRGRFLGRGKVLGDRIRNMLPRRLIY